MMVEIDRSKEVVKKSLNISVDSSDPEYVKFEFNPDEVELIRDYCDLAWKLNQAKIFDEHAIKQSTLEISNESGIKVAGDPIDDDAWAAVFHMLRPLILVNKTNEPSNFNAICSILGKRTNSQCIHAKLGIFGKQFRGEFAAMQPYIHDGARRLSGSDLFDKWVYAYEYHRVRDKQAFFDRIGLPNSQATMQYIIYLHIIEKLKAIMQLFEFLISIFGECIAPKDFGGWAEESNFQNG